MINLYNYIAFITYTPQELQSRWNQLVRSTGSQCVGHGFYKAVNPPLRKADQPESGHRRHGVWIAIEYSYKLGQKKEFKFLCVTGWFSQSQSHISAHLNYDYN